MSAEAPSLVCNLKDVVLVPMPGRHSGTRIGLAVFRGHEFPYSIDCAVRVVPPGGRAPLLDVTHWAEELGFVVAGSGEYHAADEVFPVCGGDFLLAPESTMGRNFEVVNTGTEQMVFIAFKSQRHVLNRKRQDHARAVIDQFLLRRQETSMGRAADYTFDGRILTVSHPVLRGSCTW
ncbi:MAG: cupin domain-containing protein [Methylacidiphilales bacterium]|nr:cupin domain-containing protein [Candidatus Methylacidiphilales bacterium]